MTAESQFVGFAVSLIAGVGAVLLVLLLGMVLCGVLAGLCDWRKKSPKRGKNEGAALL